ncbi:hypothetical protein KCP77_24710 (plasmid) [Salmonella enterica subsp. enterica]|nr:hypothetical protein KCP77_24710 [Salmonella enterica subsp. enterica]
MDSGLGTSFRLCGLNCLASSALYDGLLKTTRRRGGLADGIGAQIRCQQRAGLALPVSRHPI